MPTEFRDIIDGWKHLIFHDPNREKLAHNRAIICSVCEYSKLGFCTKCDTGIPCPLVTKCRSKKNLCPTNKWPE